MTHREEEYWRTNQYLAFIVTQASSTYDVGAGSSLFETDRLL